jgi:hypothetical protein
MKMAAQCAALLIDPIHFGCAFRHIQARANQLRYSANSASSAIQYFLFLGG